MNLAAASRWMRVLARQAVTCRGSSGGDVFAGSPVDVGKVIVDETEERVDVVSGVRAT